MLGEHVEFAALVGAWPSDRAFQFDEPCAAVRVDGGQVGVAVTAVAFGFLHVPVSPFQSGDELVLDGCFQRFGSVSVEFYHGGCYVWLLGLNVWGLLFIGFSPLLAWF